MDGRPNRRNKAASPNFSDAKKLYEHVLKHLSLMETSVKKVSQ